MEILMLGFLSNCGNLKKKNTQMFRILTIEQDFLAGSLTTVKC